MPQPVGRHRSSGSHHKHANAFLDSPEIVQGQTNHLSGNRTWVDDVRIKSRIAASPGRDLFGNDVPDVQIIKLNTKCDCLGEERQSSQGMGPTLILAAVSTNL